MYRREILDEEMRLKWEEDRNVGKNKGTKNADGKWKVLPTNWVPFVTR